MLFQSLSRPASGINVEQLIIELPESLQTVHLKEAWRLVADRHEILRTLFLWDGSGKFVQEIESKSRIDWEEMGEAQWDGFLERDRSRGFDFSACTPMRITLFRVSESDYRMVWTFHHALLDGRSILAVVNEVFSALEELAAGGHPDSSPSRPFGEYAQWLMERDDTGSDSFWKERLKGFTAPTPVPDDPDRDREVQDRPQYGEMEVCLSASSTIAVSGLAVQTGVTMNTLVQGAWAILLSRYTGESDVLFGATKSSRRSSIPGADRMTGLFLNTIPVRTEVDPEARVDKWLQQLRADWLALRDHEHTPLVKIKEASELPPGASLFDTLVVYENEHMATRLKALGGKWERRRSQLREQTGYALTLAAYGGAQLTLKIEFDSRLYTEGAIRRLLGHLTVILQGMAARPEGRLGTLPLLTAAERQQVLYDWNQPERFDDFRCIHELFEEHAAERPHAVAAVCDEESWTYRELNERANQMAHHLRALGVGPETRVALCQERTLDLIASMLAIIKAGGTYVPLDPSYPADRISFMISDSGVRIVIADAPGAAVLPEGLQVLAPEAASAKPKTNVGLLFDPAQTAYVIYTSGSTGKPKGCMVTQHNVLRLFTATEKSFHFSPEDTWTMFHSPAFDFSVWEIWGALLTGGRLIVVPYLVSRSPDEFAALVRRERVTILNQTPSAFRQWLAVPDEEPTPLRLVIFGGEALDFSTLRPWFQRAGTEKAELVNMYGITETTVHVTERVVTELDARSARGSLIGRPLRDLSVYVLDAEGEPVPVGVAGEMYVGGSGVARGYLNRPELTGQRFIADPFSREPGARMYRSGDLARFRAAGDLEYLGRIDQQVKLRGFRIELGEIESVIREDPGVGQVLVILQEYALSGKRLVAYIVPRSGKNANSDEIRKLLRAKLPEYMVPAAFVNLENIPLTTNGKVDRRKLPVPVDPGVGLQRNLAPPRSNVERKLLELWEEVLGISPLGIQDNFFDLGGHSLLAVKLYGKIIDKFSQENLSLAVLLRAPTVEQFAHFLNFGDLEKFRSLVPLRTTGSRPPFFCVPGGGGNVLSLRALAVNMSAKQPFYCLQSRGLDGGRASYSIEEIAAYNISEIQTVQPHG
ncbi:MAG: amino acid adenylation domain-containing protein, partial [Acidobacteriota bacterium]|nr:amino acid adenylation domain-containing protein [Acidobacteriota bacterium]